MRTIRRLAVPLIQRVVYEQQPLQALLNDAQKKLSDQRDKDFLYALCTGTVREYLTLESVIHSLLHKPLKPKDRDIMIVMAMGVYQLWHMHTPDYAAVASAVDTAKALKKPWAAGLINKLLRLAIQHKEDLLKQHSAEKAHPAWLVDELKQAYPQDWESLCECNNAPAPMTLRVNTTLTTRDSYAQHLTEANIAHTLPSHPLDQDAICLEKPVKIAELPAFEAGLCYVQDLSAQRAARLLNPQGEERILDACAAPGGKTTHLMALAPSARLTAIDKHPNRLSKLSDNLRRLRLSEEHINLITADAMTPTDWWDGELFDRLLLDAPCTGTGVIRRHPESKLQRQPKDLIELPALQKQLLTSLWPLLKSGGTLLYTTCSILPQENDAVMEWFLSKESTACIEPISILGTISSPYGQQALPTHQHDGFYYAMLVKR